MSHRTPGRVPNCLSVSLSVHSITQEVLNRFHETWHAGR